MNEIVIYAVISLSTIGTAAAVILYFMAQKFKVIEDPKIDEVADVLPGANCGGCGYPGCRNFAEEIVKANSLEGFNCPVGGEDVMNKVGEVMGLVAEIKDPVIAVIRCNGTRSNATLKINYDGPASCAFSNNLFSGESGCPNGCLGLGDCVKVCKFDAMYIDKKTGLVVVNDNCTGCGACITACPRDIIELRNKGKKGRRIFICCINTEKGGPARKNCSVACIGCGKCEKACKFDAITIENFCAYIDYEKCKLCRKCAGECPTNAIHELNFPEKKPKVEKKAESKPAVEVPAKEPVAEKQTDKQ